ncbi:helix-turn-helix domain-containing protein [Terasakiella pusilla]|uniref:helix-turn-helix domain-containing protein n=1 Tax=Terasakiella pusilla TaxID=64973 RepID=UPI003AA7BC77
MATDKIVQFPDAARASSAGRRLIPGRLTDARVVKQMSQTDLADRIGVTRQAVSAYERGSKSPEPQTMARISEVLEQPIYYFMGENLPSFGEGSPRFFRAFGPKTNKRNLMCGVLGDWFVQIGKYVEGYVNLPEVDIPSVDPVGADGRYTDEEIEQAAEMVRERWGLGVGPISNTVALLESKGVLVARCPVEGEQIEAFSFWNGGQPFVFLASNKDAAVRSRFDVVHELGHLVLHQGVDQEEIEDPKKLKVIEAEANRFAGAFLLPRVSFPNEVYTPRLDAFRDLKERWKVSIQVMVYRCKNLGIFDEDQVTNLYKQISYRKWRKSEPLDDYFKFEEPKLLNKAIELLLRHGKIVADRLPIDLKLNGSVIEQVCNLPKGFLQADSISIPAPTLKNE